MLREHLAERIRVLAHMLRDALEVDARVALGRVRLQLDDVDAVEDRCSTTKQTRFFDSHESSMRELAARSVHRPHGQSVVRLPCSKRHQRKRR